MMIEDFYRNRSQRHWCVLGLTLIVFGWANIAHGGAQVVTTTADAGPGSLRQAILEANRLPDADTIQFNIPGPGPHMIVPNTALPAVTQPLTLDGYTQPQSHPNTLSSGSDALLQIQLDGRWLSGHDSGLDLQAPDCTVRGLAVVNFPGSGLLLSGASQAVVAGNFIGVELDGLSFGGNWEYGIRGTAAGVRLGGATPADRNLIANNFSGGIRLEDSTGATIAGNGVGTDASGMIALGNQGPGIQVLGKGSVGNVIGGLEPGAGNVIAGSMFFEPGGFGIYLAHCASNRIQGNYIGTDASGYFFLGNSDSGISLRHASFNTIGGLQSGAANRIAFNGLGGVTVDSGTNAILGNAIYENEGLGIDLGPAGVDANDAGDGDDGANGLQNYPVLDQALFSDAALAITGSLDSQANTAYRLEFFASPTADPSGFGEGQILLGATNVTTDGTGRAQFAVRFDTGDLAGQTVTATATGPAGNTSEFSAGQPVETPQPPAILQLSGATTVAEGSPTRFEVQASGTEPLAYQWRFNGANLPGEEALALELPAASAEQSGTYAVVVANEFGSATGAVARLRVLAPPTLEEGPSNQTVTLGDDVRLRVTAGGQDLSFQWYFNGTPIADATRDTLTIANVQAIHAGAYEVTVSNLAGTVRSAPAMVSLFPFRVRAVRYDGAAGGNDELRALAIDPQGNIVVCGSSERGESGQDYLTVKLTTGSLPEWVARYNGPGNQMDLANALAFDTSGNVYVTGTSRGGNFDYATVKYTPAGNPEWVTRFSFGGDDAASAIGVDADGQIIVTGTTLGDIHTVKYGPDGARQWAARYNGPARRLDAAQALVIDSARNVYVTGTTRGLTNHQDYATLKYDPAGNLQWVATYSGSGQQPDEAVAIDLGPDGNIVVTGTSPAAEGHTDIVTVKYDPAGRQLWAQRYDGPAQGNDAAAALALDLSGNIYVCGQAAAASGTELVTLKYAGDGQLLWASVRADTGTNTAQGIAVDPAGTAYICGTAGSGAGADIRVVKYNAAGEEQWTAIWDHAGLSDRATAIQLDPAGAVVVAGTSQDADSGEDFLILKYDQPGLPAISATPEDQVVFEHEEVRFTVGVTNTPEPVFYWFRDGQPILGATNAGYHLADVQLEQAGTYSVLVSNQVGAVLGRAWALTVLPADPPVLTRQPLGQTLSPGDTLVLSADYRSLVPAQVQWRLNGVNLPGATNVPLVLDNLQPHQSGRYTVAVQNQFGVTESDPADVQLNQTSGAVQDARAFDSRSDLLQSGRSLRLGASDPFDPDSGYGYAGAQMFNTTGATREPGEPNHCDSVGGASYWLAFQVENRGQLHLDAAGSQFDPVLAVYTGDGAWAGLVPVACNRSNTLSFEVVPNTRYYLAVDGVAGASGVVELRYRLVTPSQLNVLGATPDGETRLQLIGQPDGQFQVEYTTNMIHWVTLVTTNAPDGILEFIHVGSRDLPRCFYRTITLP